MSLHARYFRFKNENSPSSSVRIGEYDTQSDPDCQNGFCAPPVVNHAISHVIVHPDYVSGQYHHDIALVVLKTPLNFTGRFGFAVFLIDQNDKQ